MKRPRLEDSEADSEAEEELKKHCVHLQLVALMQSWSMLSSKWQRPTPIEQMLPTESRSNTKLYLGTYLTSVFMTM